MGIFSGFRCYPVPPAHNLNGHKFSSIKQNTATPPIAQSPLVLFWNWETSHCVPLWLWAGVNHTTRLFTYIVCNLALKTSKQIGLWWSGLCFRKVPTDLVASELRVPRISNSHELKNEHVGFFSSFGFRVFVFFFSRLTSSFVRNIIRSLRRNPFICYWFLMFVSLDRVFLWGYES